MSTKNQEPETYCVIFDQGARRYRVAPWVAGQASCGDPFNRVEADYRAQRLNLQRAGWIVHDQVACSPAPGFSVYVQMPGSNTPFSLLTDGWSLVGRVDLQGRLRTPHSSVVILGQGPTKELLAGDPTYFHPRVEGKRVYRGGQWIVETEKRPHAEPYLPSPLPGHSKARAINLTRSRDGMSEAILQELLRSMRGRFLPPRPPQRVEHSIEVYLESAECRCGWSDQGQRDQLILAARRHTHPPKKMVIRSDFIHLQ